MSMWKRWLWWAGTALMLLGFSAGAWWRPSEMTEHLPAAEPAAVIDPGAGEGCARLAGLDLVDLVVRLEEGVTGWVGQGHLDPESMRVLAPVRRLFTPLASGPLAIHWEESIRTVSLLREGSVLSIHFPEGRESSAIAVVNGEVVGAEAVLCEGRLYASLGLLSEGLNLRVRWRDDRSLLVEPW